MRFFSGPSTFGAGVSGAEDQARYGPDSPWFWPAVAVVTALVSPVALAVVIGGIIASQIRRARTTSLLTFAVVTTSLALLIPVMSGDTLLAAWRQHWEAMGQLWLHIIRGQEWLLAGLRRVSPERTAAIETGVLYTPAVLVTETMLAAIPMGAWVAAGYAWWAELRRAPLAKFEGDDYAWNRRPGLVDWVRRRRNLRAIAEGKAVTRTHIGVGVGAFGALVRIALTSLTGTLLVFGRPRQGKTQQACNIVMQAIARAGGWLLLDFKGDGVLPHMVASFAAAHNRAFYHFQPADKTGAPYEAPVSAPHKPATYDPLRSGNATSKTDMLINSVGREGDAAVYFRRSYELAQLIFQVAAVTGYDRTHGGFETLRNLLDTRVLLELLDTRTPNGARVIPEDSPLHRRVTDITGQIDAKSTKTGAVTKATIEDLQALLSTYSIGPAVGHLLGPATTRSSGEDQVDQGRMIDLVRAVKAEETVVFSLSVQDYGRLAQDIGTLVLLDLANAIAQLRVELTAHRKAVGDPSAPPPWPPFYVQVEEFGSAGAEAVLGVLNKAGDVGIRVILSSQAVADIKAVDGTGVFLQRTLDQASNLFVFDITDGEAAEILSSVTPQVTKIYPRGVTEFAGGFAGAGLRAANTGQVTENPIRERQASPGDFQTLPQHTFLWVSKGSNAGVTHTHPPGPNRWVERISSTVVSPTLLPVDSTDVPLARPLQLPPTAPAPPPAPASNRADAEGQQRATPPPELEASRSDRDEAPEPAAPSAQPVPTAGARAGRPVPPYRHLRVVPDIPAPSHVEPPPGGHAAPGGAVEEPPATEEPVFQLSFRSQKDASTSDERSQNSCSDTELENSSEVTPAPPNLSDGKAQKVPDDVFDGF